MKLLTRHRQPDSPVPVATEPDAAPVLAAAPATAVGDVRSDAAVRPCATCEAPMADGQDWCLECGTAAAGRLGRRPGWRAVGTTLALTLVLIGGAGAASYAALTSDATRQAATPAPADGAPVAQVAPVVPAPPAPVIPAPVVTPPKTTSPKPPAVKLPPAPKVSTPPPVVVPEVVTPTRTPTPTPTPAPTTSTKKAAPAPPRPTRVKATGATGTTGAGGSITAAPTLTPITLNAGAVSLYDPLKRAVEPGDAAATHDGDAATVFTVGAPADGKDMQVGVVVDLGAAGRVRGLQLTTSTPGVGVEVYASNSSTLPPDIADTRWDDPASRAAIATTARVLFPRGGKDYRYVTLWFTQAPASGPKVGITELQLLR